MFVIIKKGEIVGTKCANICSSVQDHRQKF